MRQQTIDQLNKINADFYQQVSESFSTTRQLPWYGWQQLLTDLPHIDFESVLDLGCGNGRFLQFLLDNKVEPKKYLGLDSSQALLDKAKATLNYPFSEFRHFDINQEALPSELSITFVGVFGVMHHVASYNNRLTLLRDLAKILDSGGILTLSFWQFEKQPNYTKKILAWDSVSKIKRDDLEKGDHLLNWQKSGYARYCHHFSEEEINQLILESGLSLLHQFYADGNTNDLNSYLVLQNP